MAYQQILKTTGPLPIKASFNLSIDGPVDFVATSTAWTATPAVQIGIEVLINNQPIGAATLFSNASAQHLTLPTLFGTAAIQDPTVSQTITIVAATTDTVTDVNDNFVVWAHY